MKNLKISTQLTVAFAFLLFLALVLASIGIWNARNAQAITKEIVERQQINQLMTEWARSVEVRANQVIGYVLVPDLDVMDELKRGIDTATANVIKYDAQVRPLLTSEESLRTYEGIQKWREQYLVAMNAAFQALNAHQLATVSDIVRGQLPHLAQSYIGSIDALRTFHEGGIRDAQARLADNAQTGQNILLIATLLAFILGPLLAWRVMRAITHPLADAVAVADRIAHNDLSHRIHSDSNNEIGQLLQALNRMGQKLRDTVSDVRGGADSIASAASQISAGNLDLSSRTEEQASSLAETAATMEQITATVRQNADNAQQANSLATTAAKTATDGGALVSELVGTMSEINSKSQQVADIINVIDSIAFQTNILALNAAVEAARAGEQGRGFAVVAAEVRALAQRSAAAAREIKDLIDTSVAATARGNEQASHAGDTMQEIVDSINRVTDIMGEISAASREQTTGIEEINSAITQMDNVTRQNAGLVEESATAANSMQSQAHTLAQLVATFKLGSEADTHTRQRPTQAVHHLPTPPGKLVSPAAQHSPRGPKTTSGTAANKATRPALRTPGKPAPVTTETAEWTEF